MYLHNSKIENVKLYIFMNLKKISNNDLNRLKMNFCPKCGIQVDQDEKFCPSCKSFLSRLLENYCPKCGFKIEAYLDACPKCNYTYDVKLKQNIRRGLILSLFGVVSFIVWGVLVNIVLTNYGTGLNTTWVVYPILIPILLCIFGAINLSSKV